MTVIIGKLSYLQIQHAHYSLHSWHYDRVIAAVMDSHGWTLSSLLQAVMLYRVQTNWSTNEVGLLGWSKHVGYGSRLPA